MYNVTFAKFLTCVYQSLCFNITEYADESFDKYLASRGITGNLKNIVADTIGILRLDSTTTQVRLIVTIECVEGNMKCCC